MRRVTRYAALGALVGLVAAGAWVAAPVELAISGVGAALGPEPPPEADLDDPERVRATLERMVEVDQRARDVADAFEATRPGRLRRLYFHARFHARAVEIEREHVARLEALIERHGWIRRDRFGDRADRLAWLVAHHADVHPEFQERVLAILAREWRTGGTDPEHYARLFDRMAVHADRPQRFGTQGRCTERGWESLRIEAPAGVDARRRELGLEPLSALNARRSARCADRP